MKSSTFLPIRHHRLKLPQGNLFWHEAGQGDAILFLHGTWNDSSQWDALLTSMASCYHCLAPDLLGFGESSAATASYSIALEAESLEALITRLRVPKVSIVAHSLGAWVALALAQRYPERVRGLLIIEPEGFAPKVLRRRWRLDRWLVAPWSPLAWGLQCFTPLLQWFKQGEWLQQRRHRLRIAPAACQLLFQRRQAEIKAELIPNHPPSWQGPMIVVEAAHGSSPAHHLTHACLQTFPQARHQILPGADNALGFKHEALGDVLAELLEIIQNPSGSGLEPHLTAR